VGDHQDRVIRREPGVDVHADVDIEADVGVDVAVVGAGPAGSIAACAAARRGLKVALIDRGTFPRDKTCGDGIGPGAVRVLRELGLDSILAGRPRIAAVTVFGPSGERTENPVPAIPGKSADVFVVPRVQFDEHLFRAAIEAGARDFAGQRYLGMSGSDGRLRTVELRDAHGVRTKLRARLVIGADGAYSDVRRDLAGTARPRPQFIGIAMRAYAESRDFESAAAGAAAGAAGDAAGAGAAAGALMLFEFDRELLPSYGWVFPVGGGMINIGVGLPIAQARERGVDPRRLLMQFADRLRARGVEVGELKNVRGHQLPSVVEMPRLAYERAALVGDAASMINPVSGEGIAYAMTAALRLVEALPESSSPSRSLADGAALDAALSRFERDFRADHRLHFLSCRFTMALLRHAGTAALVVRAIQNDPQVLSGVFDMLFGDGRLHGGTALRIVFSNRRRRGTPQSRGTPLDRDTPPRLPGDGHLSERVALAEAPEGAGGLAEPDSRSMAGRQPCAEIARFMAARVAARSRGRNPKVLYRTPFIFSQARLDR
jgi:menaquinone-9 beta-reductase